MLFLCSNNNNKAAVLPFIYQVCNDPMYLLFFGLKLHKRFPEHERC
jgi:hypothetical protein